MSQASESRIALVTGASRGIGQAVLCTLGRMGFTVVGTATTPDGAARITETVKAANCVGQGMCLNVRDHQAVDDVLKQIDSAYGQSPLVLVNNAGITQDGLLVRMKPEQWDAVIDTNLSGAFRLSRACLRGMMKARFGRIVNMASVVGVMGNAGQANYVAAKAGLIGLTKSLALEMASVGITVNAIAPGFIETDMTDAMTDAQRQAILERIPSKKLGHVTDIAETVGFLVGPHAGYITGQTLHVNGGLYLV